MRPIRLIEALCGLLLLTFATLFWESPGSAGLTYFFGALLLFLTLYANLIEGGLGR